jgi:hypothetical protein
VLTDNRRRWAKGKGDTYTKEHFVTTVALSIAFQGFRL